MPDTTAEIAISAALEDYLETIYGLVRDNKLARVKDIARARGVRSGSVTPAMKRLSELGLIRYVQREYIDLTANGEQLARRVFARHQLLTRFFEEILGMENETAEGDACAMEHSLSPSGMDRLARLFEFLRVCPEGSELLQKFHRCSVVHQKHTTNESCTCANRSALCHLHGQPNIAVADLAAGQRGQVTHINGSGAVRQRMLDMGILPDVIVEVERRAPAGDPIWIKLQGFQLSLRKKEAAAVLVTPV